MIVAFSFTTFHHFIECMGSPLDLIFSPAYAQSASFLDRDLMSFIPIIFVFVLMYFLILRPQNKRAKQHRDMLASLRRGDRVLTAGGIIGTIHKIENNEEVSVEIAENVRVRIAKATLSQVLSHPEPLKVSEIKTSSSGAPKSIKEKNKDTSSENLEDLEVKSSLSNQDSFTQDHSPSAVEKKSSTARKSPPSKKKTTSSSDSKN